MVPTAFEYKMPVRVCLLRLIFLSYFIKSSVTSGECKRPEFDIRCISAMMNDTYANCKNTVKEYPDKWSFCEITSCEDHSELIKQTRGEEIQHLMVNIVLLHMMKFYDS